MARPFFVRCGPPDPPRRSLTAQAIRAGLVDEYQLFVGPAIGGGGNPFFPDDVRVELQLLDEGRFGNGVVYLRYVVRGRAR